MKKNLLCLVRCESGQLFKQSNEPIPSFIQINIKLNGAANLEMIINGKLNETNNLFSFRYYYYYYFKQQ